MRVYVRDTTTAVCWLDYQRLGTGIPHHIIAVITNWDDIPANFDRTSFVYDSVLFGGGRAHLFPWSEPPELEARRARIRSQQRSD